MGSEVQTFEEHDGHGHRSGQQQRWRRSDGACPQPGCSSPPYSACSCRPSETEREREASHLRTVRVICVSAAARACLTVPSSARWPFPDRISHGRLRTPHTSQTHGDTYLTTHGPCSGTPPAKQAAGASSLPRARQKSFEPSRARQHLNGPRCDYPAPQFDCEWMASLEGRPNHRVAFRLLLRFPHLLSTPAST